MSPRANQVFRLEQRCRRCGASSAVEVEGRPGVETRVARGSAVLSSALARCVVCGKRGFLVVPLSALLSVPAGLAATAAVALAAFPFAGTLSQSLEVGLWAGLAALGFTAGLRLGKADGRVRR
ncbi:MAG: hypothetical protein ACYC8T_20005 [Myxococcaceae bacterium]